MDKVISLTLKIWRQKTPHTKGTIKTYTLDRVNQSMSFLEMLDILNDRLEQSGEESIAFDHDCREGICGSCNLMINGKPHGGFKGTTSCQLHMRHFNDGDTIVIEPWRARAFPVVKDLMVDRSSFDRIIRAGGYISVRTGSVPEANSVLVNKSNADLAFNAAACIGCGACVAACKNASAMLFTAAKVSHLGLLPQGDPEREQRVVSMVNAMDEAEFGNCTNEAECEAACPKEISVGNISNLNREYRRALFSSSKPL